MMKQSVENMNPRYITGYCWLQPRGNKRNL